LVANLTNQGKLRTLLTNRVAAEILPESTRLKWTGQGDLKKQQHQNELTVDVEKLRLATQAEPIDISLKGSLSDHSANFPQLSITGKDLSVGGTLLWQNNQIQLSQLSGFFEQKLFLSGSAQAPFSKADLPIKNWFSRKDPLSVNLAITNAPLHRLARFVQPELPVQGILNSEFSTTGSPASPQINWALDATELITISAEGEPVDLGDLNLVMSTKGSIAQINGSLASPDIKPLQFSGQQPFHPADWATKRRDWKTEPLQLQLNLEPSSLAVFTPRIPEIKSLVGNIALDASVQGSFAKPTVTGYGKLDISRLKLRDRNAPSIRDMKGLVRFSGNEVILEKFNAIVAGGTLSASGRADLSQGDPVIDLAIKGKDVLVFRNHDVNVRTDVHLAATGPWQQLAIVGELGINNSYFVKNIDLLPSSLPRFRKSEVPSVESGPVVSNLAVGVPNSPFSDWTTDIRIYTKSPFLIRGNIGHGSANCDLKITGPLAAPTPIGDIIISEGTRLTLPFSRIDIETGRIRFNESTAFNGQLELKARGEADQYDINIFIHDRLLSPQHVLTSNPPLPTEDIMTLLVTGNVRDDLIGSDATRIAASKAASLFLKNLNKNTNAQSQNELLNELRDRTEIDFGSFNLNNGIDSVGGRIRLWQQLFFVGNASWDDEYRALLKYIFSFS